MNRKYMFPLLIALCVIGALILTVGVSQARFMENWTEILPFQPREGKNLVLHQVSDWVEDQGAQKLMFSLENTDTEPSEGEVYILVSMGVESPDKLDIILTVQDRSYTAQGQPIVQGSALHRSFGDGWVYHFLDDQGQKETWTLQPSSQQTFQLTVESSEEINYHSLLRLVAKKTQTP